MTLYTEKHFPLDLTITRSSPHMARSKKTHGKIPNQVRQGDVLTTPIAKANRGRPIPKEHGKVVLAHGEVTGHSHDISDSNVATQFEEAEFAGTAVLDVTAETTIVHQEHSAVPAAPGEYEVRRAEEWTDADEPRQVAD